MSRLANLKEMALDTLYDIGYTHITSEIDRMTYGPNPNFVQSCPGKYSFEPSYREVVAVGAFDAAIISSLVIGGIVYGSEMIMRSLLH